MYPPGSGVPLSVTLFWSWLCECPKRQAARCKPWFVPSCTHIMLTQYSCDEKAVDETKILRVTRSPGRGLGKEKPLHNQPSYATTSPFRAITTVSPLLNSPSLPLFPSRSMHLIPTVLRSQTHTRRKMHLARASISTSWDEK